MKKTNKLNVRRGKKGFTLAELLIVVAIIAVLVAIAVPVFSGALNKAEAAVVSANLRSARAEAAAAYLLEGETGSQTYSFTVSKDGVMDLDPAAPFATGDKDECKKAESGDGYEGTVVITGGETYGD